MMIESKSRTIFLPSYDWRYLVLGTKATTVAIYWNVPGQDQHWPKLMVKCF